MDYEIDELAIYFGDDYIVNDYIRIHQPTIGEIARFGERRYFGTVQTLTSIPSDMISILWDIGIDWEEITEWQLFYLFIANWLKPEDTKIIFGDLRFCDFELAKNENDEVIMRNGNCIIDTNIYRIITEVLRKMHGIKKKPRKAANKITKEVMIEVDRDDRRIAARTPFESQLKDMVSAMVNSSGFKYGYKEVQNIPYSTFMDSVERILAIKRADVLSMGNVSGMADLSKVPRKEWNWMRNLGKDN